MLDKAKGRTFPNTSRVAGQEEHFNRVAIDGQFVNLEPVFDEADSRQSILVSQIIARREIKTLTPAERLELAQLVVIQLLRVKFIRDGFRGIPEILKQSFAKFGVDNAVVPDVDENSAKIQSFDLLANCFPRSQHILNKNWSLVEAPKGSWFWTSDNPICITNEFVSGDIGLACQGSKVVWPIAKDLMLQFSCPAIVNKIENHDPRAAHYLRGEPTMFCSAEHVSQFNHNQVVNATRFIYSPVEEFGAALDFLIAHPEAKSPRSFIKLLDLGSHPDKLDKTLVVYGESTIHEIGFVSWEHCISHWEIGIRPECIGALKLAMADSPHREARVFDNEKGNSGMLDIELKPVGDDEATITVRHRNPVLVAIMDQVRLDRS